MQKPTIAAQQALLPDAAPLRGAGEAQVVSRVSDQ